MRKAGVEFVAGWERISLSSFSQVLRPTSYGKWVGGPMSLKGGNFSFQARTDQNQPRMDKYGTYLDFNASQGAPKHCPTLDSLTQCFARAHFRSPPGASGSLQFCLPPYSISDFSPTVKPYFSNSETTFLKHIFSTLIILWTKRVVSFTVVLVIFEGTMLCLH